LEGKRSILGEEEEIEEGMREKTKEEFFFFSF
jgi:hypothetical protein